MKDELDVLVVGPTYLDHVIVVEKFGLDTSSRIAEEHLVPGGTGFSYARNLALLGYRVGLCSILGTCAQSASLREEMGRYGIIDLCDSVIGEVDRAYVVVDKTGNKFAASCRKISGFLFAKGSLFEESMARASSVVVTSVSSQCAQRIFGGFRKSRRSAPGAKSIFFAPNRHLATHPGVWDCIIRDRAADVAVLSRSEWEAIPLKVRDDVRRSINSIVVTEGKDGYWLYSRDGECGYPPFPGAVQCVVSPNGAGEAFGSGLWAGMWFGLSFEDAGRLGALYAYQALEQPHCIPPKINAAELLIMLRRVVSLDYRNTNDVWVDE